MGQITTPLRPTRYSLPATRYFFPSLSPMNTSALKSFAPAVRTQLMEAVTRKLDFVLTGDTADLRAAASQRQALRTEAARDRSGLIERVAATWFNRFAALRFIDAHNWHPFRARVLTAATPEETQPELLKLLRTGALPEELKPHTQPDRLNDLLDGRIPSTDAQGEVYRHLVLATCRFYQALLPNLFEKLDDETELLLPDDLLTEHSVAYGFRTEITDADCAEVEILGWLYQFYISEKKDAVMARKSAVPTEDIPAVTQLFTPHWIVRYLVENSLGRLWLLNRPQSKLRAHMPYYIEGEPETDFLKITKPEDIRLCDPASGSGHMLTYAFDLLYLIYEEEGYAPSEIPQKILRHNLYGLEICPRAAQLAELALVLKAREKSRRFFQPENLVRPQIIELRDVRFAENELADYFKALHATADSALSASSSQLIAKNSGAPSAELLKLLYQFEEAKNFGSLIQPCLSEVEIITIRSLLTAPSSQLAARNLMVAATHEKVLSILAQSEALTQRYHVVVANPPYMGRGSFNETLRDFAKNHYDNAGPDLYGMFLVRSASLVRDEGSMALVTMNGWMFLGRFEKCRRWLLNSVSLTRLLHLGARAFNSLSGEVVQAAAAHFVQRKSTEELKTTFVDAREGSNEAEKEKSVLNMAAPRCTRNLSLFLQVPGAPLAHWLSDDALSLFAELPALSTVGTPRCGMITGSNALFVRTWHEVSHNKAGFGIASRDAAKMSGRKWFPYLKGGGFRKWIGNEESVVNWENDGVDLRTRTDSKGHVPAHAFNDDYIFKPSVNWNKIMGDDFGVRLNHGGFMFDDGSAAIFPKLGDLEWCAGFLNSIVSSHLLHGLNPTVNIQAWDIGNLPVCEDRDALRSKVNPLVAELTKIARADWDNYETSWGFNDQPLLRPGLKGATLEESWRHWEAQGTAAIRRMQELETENNRLFIAAYGLDGELQPEVPEAQITLARADRRKAMAAFLSYALGCMMGRYSVDAPGLILANAGDTVEHYITKVGKPLAELTFAPDEDGIIPVLDGEWFEDDIVSRTREFLRATFGPETLQENLRFIEESLGKDLRKYYQTDFYKDHLQTYKKRPIYWLVQSPKKGFSVLVYLHRYTKDTFNLILNRYLRDYQVKLRNRLAHLTEEQALATSAKAKTEARKESEKLSKILHECEEWERQVVLPLAQQRIELDLDDGVKTNYLKLSEALAPIAGLAAKEED